MLDQGRVLSPQAVTAVDVSDDGLLIAATTLAFRNNPNFWLLSDDGELKFGRAVAPWAPFQAAARIGPRVFPNAVRNGLLDEVRRV
jgi:hypothetical protein